MLGSPLYIVDPQFQRSGRGDGNSPFAIAVARQMEGDQLKSVALHRSQQPEVTCRIGLCSAGKSLRCGEIDGGGEQQFIRIGLVTEVDTVQDDRCLYDYGA